VLQGRTDWKVNLLPQLPTAVTIRPLPSVLLPARVAGGSLGSECPACPPRPGALSSHGEPRHWGAEGREVRDAVGGARALALLGLARGLDPGVLQKGPRRPASAFSILTRKHQIAVEGKHNR